MHYSHKNNGRFYAGFKAALLKAALVIAAAVLLFGSAFSPAKNKHSASAEIATVDRVMPDNAAIIQEADADFEEAVPAEDEGFVNPTDGVLTSAFGERWGRRHNGIDIGADSGTEIVAADDGTVTFAGWADGYGYYIIIDHSDGIETAYAHCSSLVAAEGDIVKKGDLIAYVGSTGNSTGPHLHFEIKISGEFVDPQDYVLY